MNTYHVRRDGEPDLCRAKQRPCPLGGMHYPTIKEAVEAIAAGTHDPVVSFGKYKGHPVSTLMNDERYCRWLVTEGDIAFEHPEVFRAAQQAVATHRSTDKLRADFVATTGELL